MIEIEKYRERTKSLKVNDYDNYNDIMINESVTIALKKYLKYAEPPAYRKRKGITVYDHKYKLDGILTLYKVIREGFFVREISQTVWHDKYNQDPDFDTGADDIYYQESGILNVKSGDYTIEYLADIDENRIDLDERSIWGVAYLAASNMPNGYATETSMELEQRGIRIATDIHHERTGRHFPNGINQPKIGRPGYTNGGSWSA